MATKANSRRPPGRTKKFSEVSFYPIFYRTFFGAPRNYSRHHSISLSQWICLSRLATSALTHYVFLQTREKDLALRVVVDHLWDVVDEYWLTLVEVHGPHDAYQIGRGAYEFVKNNPKYKAFERTREKNEFKFMRSCSSRPTEDGRFIDELVPVGDVAPSKVLVNVKKSSTERYVGVDNRRDGPELKRPRRENPFFHQEGEAHERRDFGGEPSCVQDQQDEDDTVNMNLDEDCRRDVIGREAFDQEQEERLRKEAFESRRSNVYQRLGKCRE